MVAFILSLAMMFITAETRFSTNLLHSMKYIILVVWLVAGIMTNASAQPSAREVRGAAPVVPLAVEPPTKLIVDPPLPDQLAQGRVVIQYRTENLRIVPIYGPAALNVSPRIGHLHITVDDLSWRWVDASNEPLILNGFSAGPHTILIELVDPNHRVIVTKTVTFVVPERKVPVDMRHE
jgi:hypothetical protein